MPGIVRVGLDTHVGHASPTPNPFHKTSYATGAAKVFVNGANAVRIGDTTGCGRHSNHIWKWLISKNA